MRESVYRGITEFGGDLKRSLKLIAMHNLKTYKILVVNWCHNQYECYHHIKKAMKRKGQTKSTHVHRITHLEL